jgi:hypothetical protein
MFEKIAKFRPHLARHHVPDVRQAKPANDNRPHVGAHGVRARRPRLVCRWSLIEGTNRLACHWEIEGPDEPARSLRGDGRLHKTFFQLSYQPSLNRPGSLEQARLASRRTGHAVRRFSRGVARGSLADTI